MTSSTPINKQQQHFDTAVAQAVDLLQELSSLSRDDPAWQQPDQILSQLDQARTRLDQAWKESSQLSEQQQQQPSSDFRAAYMSMVTDAFADVLENLRKNESIDVDVLVDCLQSGMEFMTQEDLALAFLDEDDDEEEDIHERHSRKLGFQVETEA